MKFFRVNMMMPQSYTVQALSIDSAVAEARRLVRKVSAASGIAPFLHSVIMLKEEEEKHDNSTLA